MRFKCKLSAVLFMAGILFTAGARRGTAQPTWTEVTTAGGPVSGRETPSAVYDPSSNSLIVFGGLSLEEPCCNNSLNEVWVLTNANGLGGTPTWMQLTPAAPTGVPAGRSSLSAVYDSANNRMIIFGGGQFGTSVFNTLYNDVWVLTNANGLGGTPSWVPLAPTGGPPPARAGQQAVYDSQNNRMIIYGGGNNGIEDVPTDVWVLTNANGLGGTPTWLQFSPANGAPAAEHYATGYDPNTNRMIFFGGCCYWTNATWALLNANGLGGTPTWMQLSPGGTLPAIRQTPAYGYDPTNNFLVIFGMAGPGTAYNDTWQLLNANGAAGTPEWMNLIPNDASGSPPIISGYNTSSASGYDIANQRLISLENTPVAGGGAILQPWVLALHPTCVPPLSIFPDTSGAAGLSDVILSNQRMNGGLLEADVLVQNHVRFWLSASPASTSPTNPLLLTDTAAGLAGLLGTLYLVPPCAGGLSLTPPFVNCSSPGEAAWTVEFCSPGTETLTLSLTTTSVAATLTEFLLQGLPGVSEVTSIVDISKQLYANVPLFKTAVDCAAKGPSASNAACIGSAFLELAFNANQRAETGAILAANDITLGIPALVEALLGVPLDAEEMFGDWIIYDIQTGSVGHLGTEVIKLEGQ